MKLHYLREINDSTEKQSLWRLYYLQNDYRLIHAFLYVFLLINGFYIYRDFSIVDQELLQSVIITRIVWTAVIVILILYSRSAKTLKKLDSILFLTMVFLSIYEAMMLFTRPRNYFLNIALQIAILYSFFYFFQIRLKLLIIAVSYYLLQILTIQLIWKFDFLNSLIVNAITLPILAVFGMGIIYRIRNDRLRQENYANLNSQKKILFDLNRALEKYRKMHGLKLPICSKCKKIRDDDGYWMQMEEYFNKIIETDFTHSVCYECSKELYGDQDWFRDLYSR